MTIRGDAPMRLAISSATMQLATLFWYAAGTRVLAAKALPMRLASSHPFCEWKPGITAVSRGSMISVSCDSVVIAWFLCGCVTWPRPAARGSAPHRRKLAISIVPCTAQRHRSARAPRPCPSAAPGRRASTARR